MTFSLLLGFSSLSFAQKQVRKEIRKGNKEYKQEKYPDAEVNYRRALEENARSIEAAYNLGNSLYKQEKRQEALEQYQAMINNETDKEKLADAWHNIGNVFLSMKDSQNPEEQKIALPRSIEAYKNALRNNPKDEETRYNLALAQKLLEDQENDDQGQDDQQDDQNQDQNQENQDQQQDQNQDQQNQDQQNQNQDQDQKEQEQKEQQGQNPNEMSKETAERILESLMQDERNTQEKVKAEEMRRQKQRKTDKNW